MMIDTLKKMQKPLTITSIVGVGLIIVMLILSLLGALKNMFDGTYLTAILLTLVLVTVCVFFLNSCLDIIESKTKLALVTCGLLLLSSVLLLIWIWYSNGVANKEDTRKINETYARISGIIAITTVLFTIIVTSNTKLHKHFIPLQVITFVLVGAIDVMLVLQICGVEVLKNGVLTIFIIMCVITFGLLCTINILSKRLAKDEPVDSGYVKIKKEEYLALVEKAKKYDEEHPVNE